MMNCRMRKKIIIVYGIVAIFFVFIWLHYYHGVMFKLKEQGRPGLEKLIQGGSGYNAVVSHCSRYTLLFLITLSILLPKDNIQYLIRMKRKNFVRKKIEIIVLHAISFTTVYMLVLGIGAITFQKTSTLLEYSFFYGLILSWCMYCLFYMLTGISFYFAQILLSSEIKAVICIFILSIISFLIFMNRIIWMPCSTLNQFDHFILNQFSIVDTVLDGVKLVICIIGVVYISNVVFKEKDVLNESK